MNSKATDLNLKRRYAAERRFKIFGLVSILTATAFLAAIFAVIIGNGYSIFVQTKIKLDIDLTNVEYDEATIRDVDFGRLIKESMYKTFPEVRSRLDRRDLNKLLSTHAPYELRDMVRKQPDLAGRIVSVLLTAHSEVDLYSKGRIDLSLPESERQLSDRQISWLRELEAQDRIEKRFNRAFFSRGSSRSPEQAGILAGLTGSLFTMLITFILSFPIGIGAAVYLEEFAPQNRFTDLIEVNINNLAAVPSIIFGLLGLAIFINFFGLPRSAPLVGGIVLALMTLPTIIIASRAAIKSVPNSIREAALGLGASRIQVVLHHVVPLAMPGMLTGSIIGMAQALGETAPLMMIGMVAFIVDVPTSVTDPSTALPVQIFMWSEYPEQGFVERAAGAIIVLLAILLLINAMAIFVRRRLERRW